MSQENLNHVIEGVLNDFAGYLTSRKERLVLSSSDDAAPMVGVISDFLRSRNICRSEPSFQWRDRCETIVDITEPNV